MGISESWTSRGKTHMHRVDKGESRNVPTSFLTYSSVNREALFLMVTIPGTGFTTFFFLYSFSNTTLLHWISMHLVLTPNFSNLYAMHCLSSTDKGIHVEISTKMLKHNKANRLHLNITPLSCTGPSIHAWQTLCTCSTTRWLPHQGRSTQHQRHQ